MESSKIGYYVAMLSFIYNYKACFLDSYELAHQNPLWPNNPIVAHPGLQDKNRDSALWKIPVVALYQEQSAFTQ